MSRSITITVPGQAPSKSNFRMYSKDWRKKWKRIKDFEEAVGKAAVAAGVKQLVKKHGDATEVYVVGYKQRCDPDNWLKSCLDGLEGVAFSNDKDVASSARRATDKRKARVVITVVFT